MSRPFLTIIFDGRWRANVTGPGAWALCRDAGGRRPAWSSRAKAWVVGPTTAARVLELAELHGMGVVVTGRDEKPCTAVPSSEEPTEEPGLW